MASPLEKLSGPGKSLQKEPPDAKEFAGLMRSGLARLSDAANATISLTGRFDLAYNAAHALCLAALRWHGYRPANIAPSEPVPRNHPADGRLRRLA